MSDSLASVVAEAKQKQASDAAQRQEVSEIMQALSEVMTFKSSPLALARGEK